MVSLTKIAADWLSKSNRLQAFPPCLTRHRVIAGRGGSSLRSTWSCVRQNFNFVVQSVCYAPINIINTSYQKLPLALETTLISSYFTKHWGRVLTSSKPFGTLGMEQYFMSHILWLTKRCCWLVTKIEQISSVPTLPEASSRNRGTRRVIFAVDVAVRAAEL